MSVDPAEVSGDERLRRFASRLTRVFRLAMPDAPGGVFIGAQAEPARFGLGAVGTGPVSLGAAAASVPHAFVRCAGEGIEYLSQIATGGEPIEQHSLAALATAHGEGAAGWMAALLGLPPDQQEALLDCVPATAILDGRQLPVPAELCLRRPDSRLRAAASTGCAAGPAFAAACLSALLELIERDAVASWWVAGRPARRLAPALLADVEKLLAMLRVAADGRRTAFLDITSDVGIPVVAALSFDQGGRGFACGTAARMDFAEAASAALLELCQLELGQQLARLKLQERGAAALAEVERRQLLLAERINTAECPRLRASGDTGAEPFAPADDATQLRRAAECVAAVAGPPLIVDLTRPQFGVAAAKAVAPGLQLYPAKVATARLGRAVTKWGGSLTDCGGIGLL